MSRKCAFQLLSLSAIWSGYYLCTKYLNGFIPAFVSGVIVRLVTIVALIILLAFQGRLHSLKTPREARPRLILIGILCFVLDTTAFIGFIHCSASVGTALLKCDILFVNLLAFLIYKRVPTGKEWGFTLLMLAGVFILLDIDYSEIEFNNVYNLLFLVSAFAVSCNAYLVQSTQKRYPQIDDMAIALYNLLFSGLCFLVVCVFSCLLPAVKIAVSTPPLLAAGLAGGILDVALFVIYYKSLRDFSVWLVKVLLLTMPVITAIMSYFFFGETLNGKQALGIAVICLGAMLIIYNQGKTGSQKGA